MSIIVNKVESLSRIAAKLILNRIKNTNHRHIYMLKDHLTSPVLEELESVTLSMTFVEPLNFPLAKKLLPMDLFVKHVKVYLVNIIKSGLVAENISYIKKMCHHVFTNYLSKIISKMRTVGDIFTK